ncbi:MAG: cytochrome c [Bradyrhizobiaceae bacterium]|nr:cytochrome c [Bradyrhizobiaceae bacterium]
MKFLSYIGALAILLAVAAGVYFLGGFYNIAASEADPDIVAYALKTVRNASIGRHATDRPTVNLDDPATIQAGARAFASRGCVFCHGAPGADYAKITEGMNPGPPGLKDEEDVRSLTAAQIFWVVKNGIGMTGMPASAAANVPDGEIWTIAAFVKKLPDVSDADFKAWTADVAPAGAEPKQ